MTDFDFTASTMTCKGKTFPARYSITPKGTVFVFVQAAQGAEKTRIRFTPDSADYDAARAAALAARASAAAEVEPLTAEAADERPETVPAAETEPARNPKTARGPIPEKPWIGDSIQGHGWKILFDGKTSRTRVIFDEQPTAAARCAVEAAGFYFSFAMQSWNKKLTFRAYRAAQVLSGQLSEIYA